MPVRALSLAPLAAAALLIAGCGGDSSNDAATTATEAATVTEAATTEAATTTTARTTPATGGSKTKKKITITVQNAAPVGGIKRATVSKGDTVTLVVASDVSDEIHVHGYNLMQDVAAGGTASITFVARVPGRFEVELEDRGTQIAAITVTP